MLLDNSINTSNILVFTFIFEVWNTSQIFYHSLYIRTNCFHFSNNGFLFFGQMIWFTSIPEISHYSDLLPVFHMAGFIVKLTMNDCCYLLLLWIRIVNTLFAVHCINTAMFNTCCMINITDHLRITISQ